MPVEKLSISLPQALAAQLDKLAAETGVSRSSLVREATARYVASRTSQAEVERLRASVDSAVAGFDEVAELWGNDRRPGVAYLADIRDVGEGPGGSDGPNGE